MPDDELLNRLLDYTKFHIGIYLSIGGGIVVLLGSQEKSEFVRSLIGSPIALLLGLICMAVAGFAGGIIASSCAQYRSFDEFWTKPQGPYGSKLFEGQTWTFIEHSFFWLGLFLITYAVLRAPDVWKWIKKKKPEA